MAKFGMKREKEPSPNGEIGQFQKCDTSNGERNVIFF